MRRLADAFLRGLVALVLRVFFRRIEVIGGERIPRQGPLLLLANHVNSLIDPCLVIHTAPRMPRFLAKSTLWDLGYMRPFLNLAAAIPVYRRHDEGVDTTRNAEMFARCHELLRDGGTIALFPEGISHNQPSLQPLKTGAARIALEAEARFGPLGIRLLPVGLLFDAKDTFRSRVVVHVGEAIEIGKRSDDPGADPGADREAVRALTDRMDEGLRRVTLNYDSWHEAELVERAADLYSRPWAEVPGEAPLAQGVPLRRAFLAGYRQLRASHPEEVAAVAAAVERYEVTLRALDLRDDQVAALYEGRQVMRWLVHTAYVLLVLLPLACLGFLLNAVPYRIPRWAARRFAPSPDTVSTYKIFTALFVYPGFWVLVSLLVGWSLSTVGGSAGGWIAGLTTLILAPITGWFALRFKEHQGRLFNEARAFLLLARERQAKALRRHRKEIYQQMDALVALYRQGEEHDA
jgi:glycerol-3-phosphate O-acyltransferase / dihydroxyacetone phosphate acyltransferase